MNGLTKVVIGIWGLAVLLAAGLGFALLRPEPVSESGDQADTILVTGGIEPTSTILPTAAPTSTANTYCPTDDFLAAHQLIDAQRLRFMEALDLEANSDPGTYAGAISLMEGVRQDLVVIETPPCMVVAKGYFVQSVDYTLAAISVAEGGGQATTFHSLIDRALENIELYRDEVLRLAECVPDCD